MSHDIVARVHRFHLAVAVSVGNGTTTYITPAQAEQLGEALLDCARLCRTVSFQESTFGTVEVR